MAYTRKTKTAGAAKKNTKTTARKKIGAKVAGKITAKKRNARKAPVRAAKAVAVASPKKRTYTRRATAASLG